MALRGNVTKPLFACLLCLITEDPVASKRATGSSMGAAAYRDSSPDWNMAPGLKGPPRFNQPGGLGMLPMGSVRTATAQVFPESMRRCRAEAQHGELAGSSNSRRRPRRTPFSSRRGRRPPAWSAHCA